MIRKRFILVLICISLVNANFSFISAQTDSDTLDPATEKIRIAVKNRGTGEKKRVEVKMKDGSKLKGYVSQSDENSFVLVDSNTKQSKTIAYSDVAKIKNRASKGDKIALGIIIGAAAVAGALLIGFIAIRCRNEGGC